MHNEEHQASSPSSESEPGKQAHSSGRRRGRSWRFKIALTVTTASLLAVAMAAGLAVGLRLLTIATGLPGSRSQTPVVLRRAAIPSSLPTTNDPSWQNPRFSAPPDDKEGSASGQGGDQALLHESLLADAVLSIVQSYYVDAKRVGNDGLVSAIFEALAANPGLGIKTGSTPDGLWLEVRGQRRNFRVTANGGSPRYQDLLEIFTVVAQMLDKGGIQLSSSEPLDKHASGTITLLNAMLSALDAHSALLSADAYRELKQGTDGAFGGLGVLVGIRDHLLTVVKPLPHSPAARAGIRKHDKILAINGTYTYGYSLDDLVDTMRGEAGTSVHLSLLREGAYAPSDMLLKREVIHVESVTSSEINRQGLKIPHLTIENFASRTSREVISAIKKFKHKNGVSTLPGLILDLRSNPGGLLDQAVQVADLFLESGVIVTTRGRREEVESAGTGFDEVDFPMVVLIDGDSASASEIVAGALQDHQRAVVIGQPSFGKGSVQTIFELPHDQALKLTIARYYTPAGRSIQNVGIIPDVWLQPLLRTSTNHNLFGPYRYKNERFLRHHLESQPQPIDAAAAGVAAVRHQPVRKAYYLSDVTPNTNNTGNEGWLSLSEDPPNQDPELNLAMQIIAKTHATYGNKLPPAANRASHWLGLAGPQIKETVDRLDQEATLWLKNKQNIDWSASAVSKAQPNLELRAGAGVGSEATNATKVRPGETIRIPWTLTNREAEAVGRASIFVRSEALGMDTKEVLIGGLPARGKRDGTIEVAIPTTMPPGPLTLRVGVAVDAWPVHDAATDVLVSVASRATAQVQATIALVDDEAGHIPGVLEGRKRGKIRVDIKNIGAVAARQLKMRLINLSGSQIQLSEEQIGGTTLGVGADVHYFVPIKAGRTLFSPELALGLCLESPDLKQAFKKRLTIPASPNAIISKASHPPNNVLNSH